MFEWFKQLDTSLFFLLNLSLRNGFFDAVMPFITNRWYVFAIPFIAFLALKGKKEGTVNDVLIIFAITFFSFLLADGTSNAIKHLAGRERPCSALENVHLLVGCGKSFSMPSNHAANAFAFATPFLVMTKSRIKYLFLLIAALVSFSRIYVGVHYPADVIVGAITGSASSLFVIYLYRWAKARFTNKPHTTVMFVFILALSLFRIYYILHGPLDLSPDEAHYWEWSRRLDLSYYSKGPVIAYLIALGTSVFGDNVFGVRILAVVFSVLSSLFLYKLGNEMYNERAGASSAVIFQIIPLFSAFGVIFTIDSPFIFFWILSLYLFRKAIDSRQSAVNSQQSNPPIPPFEKGGYRGINSELRTPDSELLYWLLLGISIGLGLLTKYTMAFFYICAFFFLVFSKQHRSLLKTSYPYIALLLSILVFSPVIIWNAQNDWVTLRHTAGQAYLAEGMQFSFNNFFEFIGSQVGILTPILFVLIVVALLKMRKNETGQFLFWFSVPVILFFTFKSLQGKAQANWAMMGYITGLIAFSEIFINKWAQHKIYLKGIIITGIGLSLLTTAVAHYPSKFHLPVKLDPSARLRGWEELGREVSAVYDAMLKEGQENVFIFSERYQVSSELAFYVKGHPITYCASLGRRMNQYDLWPSFENLVHYNAVFVTIGDTELPYEIKNAFNGYEKRMFKAYDKGRLLRDYSIFICRDFKGLKKERITHY